MMIKLHEAFSWRTETQRLAHDAAKTNITLNLTLRPKPRFPRTGGSTPPGGGWPGGFALASRGAGWGEGCAGEATPGTGGAAGASAARCPPRPCLSASGPTTWPRREPTCVVVGVANDVREGGGEGGGVGLPCLRQNEKAILCSF